MNPNNQQFNPNQYDFITNPTPPPNKPVLGGSMKSRMIIVVGGFFLAMILLWIVSTIVSSGGKQATTNLKRVVAEEQEIIRVTTLAETDAIGSDAKGYALTVNFVMTSNQKSISDQLLTQKIKLTKEEQAMKMNPKTDEILKSSKTNNQYDSTFINTVDELLKKHQKTVKNAFDTTDSLKTKEVLKKIHEDCETLLSAKSPNN